MGLEPGNSESQSKHPNHWAVLPAHCIVLMLWFKFSCGLKFFEQVLRFLCLIFIKLSLFYSLIQLQYNNNQNKKK